MLPFFKAAAAFCVQIEAFKNSHCRDFCFVLAENKLWKHQQREVLNVALSMSLADVCAGIFSGLLISEFG